MTALLEQHTATDRHSIRPDRALLYQFVHESDQQAFATILHRHGSMVLAVCRRILRHREDAEDAFQATFLLLAQKAHHLAHDQLGPWLHNVAYRIALKARTMRARRQHHEQSQQVLAASLDSETVMMAEVASVLDQELLKLPRSYRLLLILCDLQGGTFRQVARQLDLPVGTLSGRLKRGRQLLAKRLTRRGIALSTTVLGLLMSEQARAVVPVPLFEKTLQASVAWIAAELPTPVLTSARVNILVKGMAVTMMTNKLKVISGWLALLVCLTASWNSLGRSGVVQAAAVLDEPSTTRPAPVPVFQHSAVEQYMVEMRIVNAGQSDDVVASPRLVVLSNQKSVIQIQPGMPVRKLAGDWETSTFMAETLVKPVNDQRVNLELKCDWTNSRDERSDNHRTVSHVETINGPMKLNKWAVYTCQPFGQEVKVEVRIARVLSNPVAPPASTTVDKDASTTTRVYKLRRADAQSVSIVVKQLFNQLISVSVDARTNAIIIKANPANHAELEQVISKLDSHSKTIAARHYLHVGKEFPVTKAQAILVKLNVVKNVELLYHPEQHIVEIQCLDKEMPWKELASLFKALSELQ
jgi:RNA polymerase sigma factor (sigma-70 family)